jgi:hypothetical protein
LAYVFGSPVSASSRRNALPAEWRTRMSSSSPIATSEFSELMSSAHTYLRFTVPFEGLGHYPELDDNVARLVFGFNVRALFPPKAKQGRLVIAHDDPGI